jgi:hypothetical protein
MPAKAQRPGGLVAEEFERRQGVLKIVETDPRSIQHQPGQPPRRGAAEGRVAVSGHEQHHRQGIG